MCTLSETEKALRHEPCKKKNPAPETCTKPPKKKRKQPTRRVDKAFETVDNRLQSSLSEKIVVTSSTESSSSSSSSPRRSSSSCSSKKGRPETHFMCTLNSLLVGGVEFSSSKKIYFGTDWSGARGWGTTFRESRKLFFIFLVVYMIFFICENQTQTCTTQKYSVLERMLFTQKKIA